MADMIQNIATGAKANIDTALEAGTIGPGTLVITSDTTEAAFIDESGNVDFLKETLGEDVTINGVNVGGLTDGLTLSKDMTVAQIMKKMLQKAIPATYTAPKVAIANNGGQAAGNVEAGTSVTMKLKATFTQNDAGALTTMNIKKGAEVVATGSDATLTYEAAEALVVGDETVSFTAEATYEEGATKKNNLGEDSPNGKITAGTITSSKYNLIGLRNAFYGCGVGAVPELTSDIVRGLSGKKLNPAANTTLTISVAEGQQYILFAYPSSLRDVTTVKYEETNDATYAQNFTKTLVNVADARGGENGLKEYKVYSYAMDIPAPAAMTFTVTI